MRPRRQRSVILATHYNIRSHLAVDLEVHRQILSHVGSPEDDQATTALDIMRRTRRRRGRRASFASHQGNRGEGENKNMTAEDAINFFHSPRIITVLFPWQDGNIVPEESASPRARQTLNFNNPQEYQLLRFSSVKRHDPSNEVHRSNSSTVEAG
jgi:hypothetical protein